MQRYVALLVFGGYAASVAASALAADAATVITVKTGTPGAAISDLVYGANDYAGASNVSDLPFPIFRWGGNHTTRYNWRLDAWNPGKDWYFLNLAGDYTPAAGGQLSHTDRLILRQVESKRHALVTIPMTGWVAKDRKPAWGYSVRKYGKQQSVESSQSGGDAGNGVLPSGKPLLTGDPNDTSIPVGPEFMADWSRHIQKLVSGKGDRNAVRFYAMDNEPALWHETHQDLRYGDRSLKQPKAGYDELWERTVAYASAIKQADPKARILGPVSWGWCEYHYSPRDSCAPGPDRAAHGDKPFLAWYLQQVCSHQKKTGTRLIDYLDVHYYSMLDAGSDDESPKAQRQRLDGTRALHEIGFKDGSWIQEPIQLIPRLKAWIQAECPGIGIAITEYRFGGGDKSISAALANAEAMAIFGRDGVDIATFWSAIGKGSLLETAHRLFLDYDGKGASALGGHVVDVTSAAPVPMPAYGIATGRRLLVYVFNKTDKPRAAELAGVAGWRLSRRFQVSQGTGLVEVKNAEPTPVVPALSVMLFELQSR